MSSELSMTESAEIYLRKLKRLKNELESADTVIVGAGKGLSVSAGLDYTGERFQQYFYDFAARYGFQDMASGCLYPFGTPEEYWAYWSRCIYLNRYVDAPRPVYRGLFELLKKKDYFIVTINQDHCFRKAGFDKERLFYMQGDYGLFQCSIPCCQNTFENKVLVTEMIRCQRGMRIPSRLVPRCPHCGSPLTLNLRSDDSFVEDAGWHQAAERYSRFLREKKNGRVLFLTLGVGHDAPVIIRYPFWRMTEENPRAVYACVSCGEDVCPQSIRGRSVCINGDIGDVLEHLPDPASLEP